MVNSIIPSKLPAQNIARYASDSKKDCVVVTASTIRPPVPAAPIASLQTDSAASEADAADDESELARIMKVGQQQDEDEMKAGVKAAVEEERKKRAGSVATTAAPVADQNKYMKILGMA